MCEIVHLRCGSRRIAEVEAIVEVVVVVDVNDVEVSMYIRFQVVTQVKLGSNLALPLPHPHAEPLQKRRKVAE